MELHYVTNIFDLHTFGNETTALLKIFDIFMETHFVSLFFKYYNLTFDDTFKMRYCPLY